MEMDETCRRCFLTADDGGGPDAISDGNETPVDAVVGGASDMQHN